MPILKNVSNAHLFLPREDGLKPDIELLPERTFNGSEAYYKKFIGRPEYLLERQTDGLIADTTLGVGGASIIINVEGFIKNDAITATAADADINAQLTSDNNYSAWGKVKWSVGVNNYSMFFSVKGSGIHGSGATFSLSASTPVGATTLPIVAGSALDLEAGIITLVVQGAGAFNPSSEVIYEISLSGYRAVPIVNPLLEVSNLTTTYTFNTDKSVKTKKIFYTGSKAGDPAKKTTYTYNADGKIVTEVVEQSFVEQTDLS